MVEGIRAIERERDTFVATMACRDSWLIARLNIIIVYWEMGWFFMRRWFVFRSFFLCCCCCCCLICFVSSCVPDWRFYTLSQMSTCVCVQNIKTIQQSDDWGCLCASPANISFDSMLFFYCFVSMDSNRICAFKFFFCVLHASKIYATKIWAHIWIKCMQNTLYAYVVMRTGSEIDPPHTVRWNSGSVQ